MSTRPTLELSLADLHLSRILKPYLRAKRFIIVITLPENSDIGEWRHAAEGLVSSVEVILDDWQQELKRNPTRVEFIVTPASADQGLEGIALGQLKTIILVKSDYVDAFLAHPTVAAADAVLHIRELSVVYMQRAFQIAIGRKISASEAADLVSMPEKMRRIIARAGRNPSSIIAAFKRAEKKDVTVVEPPKKNGGPRLEDMHGYAEASVWGLELAQDIADYKAGVIHWSDVDSGLMISGPPGCGKTTFAAALARTCDMAFVVGSYASWQSTGHQGDCLKAMRKAFVEAREKAPCILLIDEIDGFVTRGSSSGSDNGDYLRGIVNGLLEELDGSAGRDGVVVIGACNDPSIVDPALVRPGRLDRHIAIELPDDEARMAILKGHLKSAHDLDMRLLCTKTVGMTGADLERLARDARRIARRERITVEYRHVNACLPVRMKRNDDQLYRIAVHEIGHAVVGAVLQYAPLLHVFIEDHFIPNGGGQVAGGCTFQIEAGLHQDQNYVADRICSGLGAMACEQMILGSHGDGVIVDLEEATNAATFALASVGMGDTLSSSGLRDPAELARLRMYDPRLSVRVEELLQEQLNRALGILEERRDVVEALISQLVQRKRLPWSVVYEALDAPEPAQNFG